MYIYNATITEVIDGDTFRIDCDMGFYIHLKDLKIRLLNIDCPEKHESKKFKESEKEYGLICTEYAKKIFLGKNVEIQTIEQDSFGRWLAYLWYYDEDNNKCNIVDLYNSLGINKLNPSTYSIEGIKKLGDELHGISNN